jgi:hypothetical protein
MACPPLVMHRGLCNAKLLLKDRVQCLQAVDFLLAKQRSRSKTHASLLQRLASDKAPPPR